MSAAENMAMQVRHGFATVRAVVEHEPVAARLQTELLRHGRRFEQQVAEDLMVLRPGFGEARDGFLRHDQHMRRGLWIDVTEGADQVVLENDLRRDFARDDFFKQGFAHAASVARA